MSKKNRPSWQRSFSKSEKFQKSSAGASHSETRLGQNAPTEFPYPGRRARIVAPKIVAVVLALLVILSPLGPYLPTLLSPADSPSSENQSGHPTSSSAPSPTPSTVGADKLPSLSLPQTVVSSVNNLIDAGGIVQVAPDNLTLYNSAVVMRLLGGPAPRDELLSQGRRILSLSFWNINVNVGGSRIPLIHSSSIFTVLGTNSTGTYVSRTMTVSDNRALYGGIFTIVYKATSRGLMKWDLIFVPTVSAHYEMVYTWSNITDTYSISNAFHQLRVVYPERNYTLSWGDVSPQFATSTALLSRTFTLSIDLGTLAGGSKILIDPNLVGSSNYPPATGFTFQRKVFYEPQGGRYWAFYSADCVGYVCGLRYSNSADGTHWSTPGFAPSTECCMDPSQEILGVSYPGAGTLVLIAWGRSGCGNNYCIVYVLGNINGSQITWGTSYTVNVAGYYCYTGFGVCTLGTRYVYGTVTPNGKLAFSYNTFTNVTGSHGINCDSNTYTESDEQVAYVDPTTPNWEAVGPVVVKQTRLCVPSGQSGVDKSDQDRSILLPSDSQGKVRVLYQSCAGCSGNPSIHSEWVDFQGRSGPDETVAGSVLGTDEFSAINDADYGAHLVYRTTDGRVAYAYHSSSDQSPWVPSPDIFSGVASQPTITVDYSTNDVYVFGITACTPLCSVIMRSKSLSQRWSDGSAAFPITGRASPAYLTSNAFSASTTNSSQVLVFWTEGNGPYSAWFASIPIKTVWSPFGDPCDPWDRNGLAPFGQYFQNMGEYVSPSTGMLSVIQTDLSLPGRGLSMEITRVYTEPSSFLSNNPYGYEGPYGFRDDDFTTGWTLNPPGTFSSDGDIATVTVTATPGSPAIQKAVQIDTSIYRYMVWRLQGSSHYQVGVWVGSTLYKYSPSSDPAAPSSYTTVVWDVGATTGGATVNYVVLWAVGVNGDYVNYDYTVFMRASIGNGWQLNFPWFSQTYLHLWNGEGYRIPYNFWIGTTNTFENHQGENFRLVRHANSTVGLYSASGTYYRFNSNRLSFINDATGNNTISLNYEQSTNRLWNITDTVGRVFRFYYNNSLPMLVQSINQTASGGVGSVRGVTFTYDGKLSLISVRDPAGRPTNYAYQATTSSTLKPWLLSQITYPTQWYSSYKYIPFPMGTTATSYRVYRQLVNATNNSPIRWFNYTYTPGPGDSVISSMVAAYNGTITSPASFTNYAFSFAGVGWNITDGSHNFLKGYQEIFGVHGEVPREITLVSPNLGYANYYRYDLWGNQIYSRNAINPSTNSYHESFSSYYNSGTPPGFYAFQDSFSGSQGTAPDNQWNTYNGTWIVKNGTYTGTNPAYKPTGWDNFAWADLAKPDISLQASAYFSQALTNTDGRFGIFVHYPGSKQVYKWALVIHQRSSNTYLELLDEVIHYLSDPGVGYGQSTAIYQCPVNPNVWYTFNMTVRGYNAIGTLSAPGMGQPCQVSGTFPSNSPAAGGTGFGLYSGGYSVRFDDVRASTVAPYITGTAFSNSFFQYGAPGPTGLNTWLVTTKPPSAGWKSLPANWLNATSWDTALGAADYGASPWGQITSPNPWQDQQAQWIWWNKDAATSSTTDPVWFRRVFYLNTNTNLNMEVTADDGFTVYIDGNLIGSGTNWQTRYYFSYQSNSNMSIGIGYHLLGIKAYNTLGPAGLLLSVTNAVTGGVLFRSDAVAGPNVIRQAGTAQLTNGAGSIPQETYYSYYTWGGLNQQKSRYDIPQSLSSGGPLAIDGSTLAGCSNATQSCSVVLTTSKPNDIIIAYASEMLNYPPPTCTFSITDTAGLTWNSRGPSLNTRPSGTYGRDQMQEFWAKSSNILSADTITESISGCGNNYNYIQVVAISGANINNPFDSNIGLPVGLSGYSGDTSVSISTMSPNGMVIAALLHGYPMVPTAGQGFTLITSGGDVATEYKNFDTTPLSNFAVTFGFGVADYWMEIADVIQAPTQWPTLSRTYDYFGNPRTFGDPRGNVVTSTYNSTYQNAYLTSNALSDGSLYTYGYNVNLGSLTSVTDPKGNTTQYTYDNLGRTTRIRYALSAYVNYTYNDRANYVDIVNENLWKTRQIYDGLGRLQTIEKFISGIAYSNTTYTYNWMDKTSTQTEPLLNTYRYDYDALGRITTSTKPDGNVTRLYYDDLNSWIRSVNEDGVNRCTVYDRLGRLITVIELANSNPPYCVTGQSTVYTYDEVGDLTRVTNANQQSTVYTYDSLNRVVQASFADASTEVYSYDSNGNLVKKVDPSGINSLYSYDSNDRPTTVTHCGNPITSQTYTYDANGNVLSLQNQNATLTYIYDARNRLLNETYSINPATRPVVNLGCSGSSSSATGGASRTYTVSFTYAGETLASIVYPTTAGNSQDISIGYAYDTLGRMLNVTRLGTSTYYARSLTYYKNDQIKGLQFGNNLIGNYTYDRLSRPLGITLSGATTMRLYYGYNKTGTVSSVTGLVNGGTVNEQYRYDALQRLTNATVTSSSGTTRLWYQYDNLGNRLAQSVNGTVTTYTYNTMNELTGSSSPGTTAVYAYDRNGNLLNKNVTAGGTVRTYYTWDVSNHLLKATNGTGQALFAYDGDGRRVEGIEGGATSFYAYTGTGILYKNILNTSNNAYVYAAGLRISNVVNVNEDIYYFHTDGLGSTRIITYTDSTYVYINNYQPFGQDNGAPKGVYKTKATDKFQGMPYSSATGLYYDFMRWYDPSVGRFISADPAGGSLTYPQSQNPYVSFLNAPTNNIDPDGASAMDVLGATSKILATFVESATDFLVPRTTLRIVWGPGRLGQSHTIVEAINEAAQGKAKQAWKYERAGYGASTYHQGGYDPVQGKYSHEGYADVDPRVGEAAEGFSRFAQLARAQHAMLLIGAGLTAWHIGSTFYSDYTSGQGYDRTIRASGEEASGWTGAYLGAEILGSYGADFGLEFGGLPGAAVGGVVGGLAGSIIGYTWGTQVFDDLTSPSHRPYAGVPCSLFGISPSDFYSGFQCGQEAEF